MFSEKKQELALIKSKITNEITLAGLQIEIITKNYICNLLEKNNINTSKISVDFDTNVIYIKYNYEKIITMYYKNNSIHYLSFYSFDVQFDSENHNCFNIIKTIYESFANKTNEFIDFKNEVNKVFVKKQNKKETIGLLEWAETLMSSCLKEIKKDEILNNGYYFDSTQTRWVKSFDNKEVCVYGIKFTKNPTGTYLIHLLSSDKSIKAQSTRASEETLQSLINYFV